MLQNVDELEFYQGTVIRVEPRDTMEWPLSPWETIVVDWGSDEVSSLSPWELHRANVPTDVSPSRAFLSLDDQVRLRCVLVATRKKENDNRY